MSTPNPFEAPTPGGDAFDPNAWIGQGGGGIAVKWPTVGHVVEGTILGWSVSPQTDMDGEPVYMIGRREVLRKDTPDGKGTGLPLAQQLVVELQCEATGLTWETNQYIPKPIPDDDGLRVMYVKGSLRIAFSKAVADGQRMEKGGRVRITRLQSRQSTKDRMKTAHQYDVQMLPASQNSNAANDFLAKTAPATPQFQAPPAAPAPEPWASQQPAAAPAPGHPFGPYAQPQPVAAAPAAPPAAPPNWGAPVQPVPGANPFG